jgi:hypothetical protein
VGVSGVSGRTGIQGSAIPRSRQIFRAR